MSTLSQFLGVNRPPKTLVNATSSAGANISPQLIFIDTQAVGQKIVASGALTANVLSTVISVTGGGMIPLFYLAGADATSRTHRVKMTVDGVVVYDYTTAAVAAANKGLAVVGFTTAYTSSLVPDPVYFNSSLLIEYASSVSETGKTNFAYIYRTH